MLLAYILSMLFSNVCNLSISRHLNHSTGEEGFLSLMTSKIAKLFACKVSCQSLSVEDLRETLINKKQVCRTLSTFPFQCYSVTNGLHTACDFNLMLLFIFYFW